MTYLTEKFKADCSIDVSIENYYKAAKNPDGVTKGMYTRYLTHLISSGDPSFTPDHYRTLILPALGLYLFDYKDPIVFVLILNALNSPACPTDVLAAACHCITERYRRTAALNPNCPEEDSVYAYLGLANA